MTSKLKCFDNCKYKIKMNFCDFYKVRIDLIWWKTEKECSRYYHDKML